MKNFGKHGGARFRRALEEKSENIEFSVMRKNALTARLEVSRMARLSEFRLNKALPQ